jgi:RNA polymerase sigma-70 factor (ECF subfamily)
VPRFRHEDASDDRLAAAARNGDVRALESLLDRNQSRVLRTLRLLGVAPQDREDVAQEVFIRVLRHLGGYRPGRSFGAWLYRVTVNAAHDHRSRKARRVSREEEATERLESAPDPGPGPAEAAGRGDLKRALEAALGVLTERERAVFVLRELEALETAEVARTLGITRITVRRHLGRARERLRSALESVPQKKGEED